MDFRTVVGHSLDAVRMLAAVGLFLLLSVCGYAQENREPGRGWSVGLNLTAQSPRGSVVATHAATGIREAPGSHAGSRLVVPLSAVALGLSPDSGPYRTGRRQPPRVRRERSTRSKVLGGVVGGVAGFFGGVFLGAAIEGKRCHCDDPGITGALIGAPLGGVTGAALGYMFLF